MQLGETVDGLVEQVRPRVLEAVPARIVGGVAQSEVGALVDDRGSVGDQPGHQLGGRSVGERHEDRVERLR